MTLYRDLRERIRLKALQRSDRGKPRKLPQDEMEFYCEVIAALKVRTSNKAGRHLSTAPWSSYDSLPDVIEEEALRLSAALF